MKKVIVKYYEEHPTWPSTVKEQYESVPEGWVEVTIEEYKQAYESVKEEMEAHFNAIAEQQEAQLQAEAEAQRLAEEQLQAEQEAEFQAFLAWKAAQAGE